MKRHYMVLSGCVCLVFAYANIFAGKVILGYMCGLAALLVGWFFLYMIGANKLHWFTLVLHIPFVCGSVALLYMPYTVSTSLGMLGFMSIGYSLMVQMVMKELTVKECRSVVKSLFALGCAIFVVWLVALSMTIVRFDWILVGNDWMLAWDAIRMEVVSMAILVGMHYLQVGCMFFQRSELILN